MENSHLLKQLFRLFPAVVIITLAALLRLLPHPPNVVPIAAMALFGGVYLDRKYALVFPLVAMLVSDVFLGFHQTMVFVYGSFLLTGLIGIQLKRHKKPGVIFLASLVSSCLFYVITNFGVWVTGTLYSKTITGLFDAYILALPFFRNTLVGDVSYTVLLFGGYELFMRVCGKDYADLYQDR